MERHSHYLTHAFYSHSLQQLVWLFNVRGLDILIRKKLLGVQFSKTEKLYQESKSHISEHKTFKFNACVYLS